VTLRARWVTLRARGVTLRAARAVDRAHLRDICAARGHPPRGATAAHAPTHPATAQRTRRDACATSTYALLLHGAVRCPPPTPAGSRPHDPSSGGVPVEEGPWAPCCPKTPTRLVSDLRISGWVVSRERCRGGGSCAFEQRSILPSLSHWGGRVNDGIEQRVLFGGVVRSHTALTDSLSLRVPYPCLRHAAHTHAGRTAMRKLRIVTKGFGDREWPLNDGQIPNVRVVREHASTGYSRVGGGRRASRNGRVPKSRNPDRSFFFPIGAGRRRLG
jgi:hypothetical protein